MRNNIQGANEAPRKRCRPLSIWTKLNKGYSLSVDGLLETRKGELSIRKDDSQDGTFLQHDPPDWFEVRSFEVCMCSLGDTFPSAR